MFEIEVKRCLHCGKEIAEGRLASYCDKACKDAAYYRRYHPKMTLTKECLCYYNDEVLCVQKECEKCGWNPVVEKRRKEALACQFDQLMPTPC